MSSRSETSQVKLEVSRYTPPELLGLVAVTVILICIGTVNIYSSTQYMNIISGDSTYSHLARHLLFLSISVITAFVLTKLPIKLVRKGALVWVIGTVLLLCLVIVAGKNVNGATRWIQLGPVSLQPSEFAKVTGIIWASSYLAKKVDAGEKIALIPQVFRAIVGIFVSIFLFASGSKRKKNKKYTFGQLLTYISPLAAPLVMAALVMKQPDMGTAAIILLLPCLLYIIAGLPAIEILLGGAGIGTLGLLLALSSAYRRDRLFVLWDPFSDAAGKGYQTVQSLIAVGSGGFLGQGICQVPLSPRAVYGLRLCRILPGNGLHRRNYRHAPFHGIPAFGICHGKASEGFLLSLRGLWADAHDLASGAHQYGDGSWIIPCYRRSAAFHFLWRHIPDDEYLLRRPDLRNRCAEH